MGSKIFFIISFVAWVIQSEISSGRDLAVLDYLNYFGAYLDFSCSLPRFLAFVLFPLPDLLFHVFVFPPDRFHLCLPALISLTCFSFALCAGIGCVSIRRPHPPEATFEGRLHHSDAPKAVQNCRLLQMQPINAFPFPGIWRMGQVYPSWTTISQNS